MNPAGYGKRHDKLRKNLLTSLNYEPALFVPTADELGALSKLDERLSGFVQNGGGTRTAIQIQPGDCMVWDGNPRDQPGLTPDSCRSLIESIANEGGNRIPVLVRLNGSDSERPYELLAGSRRRFAIDWLNHNGRPELRLNALIVDLSDEEAFRLADIENRERADITELDRARSYQNAVDRFYGGVQSRMAEALNLSNSQLSRLLSLAQLPEEVVAAFATNEELRVRHSEVLTPLLRRPETYTLIVAEALLIAEEQQLPRAPERSHDSLLPACCRGSSDAAVPPAPEPAQANAIMAGDMRVGSLRLGREGGLQIDLGCRRRDGSRHIARRPAGSNPGRALHRERSDGQSPALVMHLFGEISEHGLLHLNMDAEEVAPAVTLVLDAIENILIDQPVDQP